MTLMITTTRSHAATAIRRRLLVFLGHLGRLVDGWVAAMIADFERRAEAAALHHLSDRQLKDIGLYRCQIESALAEAGRDRLNERQSHGI
jgi:uncharacterized protein YjiS (DUF1127 family)